jgi:hypothetical protein
MKFGMNVAPKKTPTQEPNCKRAVLILKQKMEMFESGEKGEHYVNTGFL